jgi:polyisoprenoid-binding protein YceI
MKMPFLATLLMMALPAAAQQQTFTVNPEASHVNFALAGSGHHVQGSFHVESGSIHFDLGAHTISGSVVVAAGSGNSGDSSRDKKMNKDVLETPKYSQITFEPRSYQGSLAAAGDSSIQVSGIFTLHGTPHELTVPMQIHIEGTTLRARGQFTVPYVQWGLKDPSIFVLKVAKEVGIELDLAGQLAQP